MKGALRVVVVDDDPGILEGVTALLRDEGYRPSACRSTAECATALQDPTDPPAAVVLDLRLPGESGLDFLARFTRPLPCPVIVLSGEASPAEAVRALKLGASDFVEKPPSPERLLTAVANALAFRRLSDERDALRDALRRPGGMVGESEAMVRLRQTIAKVGPSEATVLITGETGVGKERVAQALHEASRRPGRLVAINCAAIPEALLESELFGHERGAFTGATARRIGRIEQAHEGTLLLDEVGDLPMALQAKLLRVLEQREVEPLGGRQPRPVNVRVLAATHRELLRAVSQQTFRQDLFYRLNVFPLVVPPLRERTADILPLVRAFASELAPGLRVDIDDAAASRLVTYPWPGNVRELKNFVERTVLVRSSAEVRIGPEHVALLVAGNSVAGPGQAQPEVGHASYRELVDEFERALLAATLARTQNNIAAAARLLKLDRGNLHRRLQALGLKTQGEEPLS